MIGYSLVIGVDEINERHYGLETYPGNAGNSAIAIHNYIKEETSIKTTEDDLFVDKNAILNDVILRIEALAELSRKEESFVFIFLVGHGKKFIDEEDKTFSFFKLFDQMLFENEFKNALQKFDLKTKLFCICDFCYAGSYVDKENFISNNFGIREKDNFSYKKILKQYHSKLNINLNTGKHCPTFIIASVAKDQWARVFGTDNKYYAFSYQLLLFLNSGESTSYYELYLKLKTFFITLSKQQSGSTHTPEYHTLNSNISYFNNHKPFKF